VHWIDLAHDRGKWRVLVNTLMKFGITQNARNSSTSRGIVTSQKGTASLSYIGLRAHRAVGQLVEALRYNQECCGLDSRWCHCKFSLIQSFRPHYGPGFGSASNRNEYQEYFLGGKGGRCIGLTLSPSCGDFLEIWEPQPSWTLMIYLYQWNKNLEFRRK
jgi:hypothetical protein